MEISVHLNVDNYAHLRCRWRKKMLKAISGPAKRMPRKFYFLLCLPVSLWLSCAWAQTPHPITVQLQWKHQFEFAGFYAAIYKGFYAQRGLQVELREYRQGLDVVEEVLSGRAQYGILHSGIVQARLEGEPVKLLANYFKRLPLVILAMPEIEKLADLRGKRLMIAEHELDAPLLKLAFETEQIVVGKDVHSVPHTFNAEPFLLGEVDAMTAFVTNEPFYLEQQGVAFNVLDLSGYMRSLGDEYLFTSDAEASRHPRRVQDFTEATNEGWRYALEHKEDIVDLILTEYSRRKSREALLYEADKTHDMVLPLPLPIGGIFEDMVTDVATLIMQQEGLEDHGYLQDFIFDSAEGMDQTLYLSAEERRYLAETVFRIAQTDDWKPLTFKDADSAFVGIAVDYWNLIAAKLGLRTEFIGEMPFAAMHSAMQAGALDIIAQTAKALEHEGDAHFSIPYEHFPIAIAARKDTPYISKATLLHGQKVAVGRNHSVYHLFKTCCPDIDFVQVENTRAALELLEYGKVFAAVDILPVLQYQLGNFPAGKIKLAGVSEVNFELSVMVQRRHARLVPLLDRAITAITEAERQAVSKKWMHGPTVVTRMNYTLLWQIAGILALIIALILYWNRKLAHSRAALKHSEDFIRTTMDALSEHLCVLDENGAILTVNRAWREFSEANHPAPENCGTGANYLAVCDKATGENAAKASLFAANLRAMLRGELDEFSLEYSCDSPAEQCWFIARVSRFPGSGPLRLLVTHENITERKRAEETIVAAKQAAERALHERNLILANALVGIVLLKERRFVWANDHAVALFGYSREEMLGRTTEFLYANPADYRIIGEEAPPILARGEAYQSEFRLRRKDGTPLWCLISGRAMDPGDLAQGALYIILDIEVRRQAEARLRTSEARYRALLDATSEGYWWIGPELRTVEVNLALCEMLGYTENEMRGRSPLEFADEENQAIFKSQMAKIETTVHRNYEITLRGKHGNAVHTIFHATTLRGEDGEVQGGFAFISDISELKQAETHLREAEEKYRTVADFTYNWEYWLDPDGRYRYISPSCERITGYTAAEFFADPKLMTDIVHPDDREVVRAHVKNVGPAAIEPKIDFQFRVFTKDGRMRWIEHVCQAVINEEGIYLGRRASNRDITERKHMELALQQSAEHLFKHNQFLMFLSRASHSFSSSLDLDEVLDTVLKEILELMNISADYFWLYQAESNELICQHAISKSSKTIIGYRLQLGEGITGQAAQQRNTILVEDTRTDPRHYRKIDETSGIEIRSIIALPLLYGAELQGILVCVDEQPRRFDESDRKMLEAIAGAAAVAIHNAQNYTQMVELKQRAEAASRAKSAFLANMSHELRTPLNAVLGYAQILQRDTTIGEAQRQQVDTIKRSGDYLLTLINDVLDLSKVEAGRLELMPGPCRLRGFFTELSDLFRLRAQDKGIAFDCQVSAALPASVEVDDKRLRQICMNLLGNAVKFTEQGEVRLEVDYHPPFLQEGDRGGKIKKEVCGELIIRIGDTGIGISPALHEEIFKPFRQAGEDQYKQQGTGLGLAISHSLVEQMGGCIQLDSEEGRGSRFTVRIPVPELEPSNAVMPAVEPGSAVVSGYRRTDGEQVPLRVLVVDDGPVNRGLLRELLTPLGFAVSEAGDGSEAVTITESQAFDIILMDLVMPHMDGLEATRRILARPGANNRVIVAVSARAFEENRAESLTAGCREHLSKPLSSKQLLRVLQALLPLEWKYRENTTKVVAATPTEATPAALASISAEWLDSLEQALIAGHHGQASDLVAQLEPQDGEPGKTLKTWLERYEYLRLLEWIEQQASKRD